MLAPLSDEEKKRIREDVQLWSARYFKFFHQHFRTGFLLIVLLVAIFDFLYKFFS